MYFQRAAGLRGPTATQPGSSRKASASTRAAPVWWRRSSGTGSDCTAANIAERRASEEARLLRLRFRGAALGPLRRLGVRPAHRPETARLASVPARTFGQLLALFARHVGALAEELLVARQQV